MLFSLNFCGERLRELRVFCETSNTFADHYLERKIKAPLSRNLGAGFYSRFLVFVNISLTAAKPASVNGAHGFIGNRNSPAYLS